MLLATAIFMVSCQGNNQENGNLNPNDSLGTGSNILPEGQSLVYTKYKLPLPVEMYKFVKESNPGFKKEILNSIEDLNRFPKNVDKAVNLGMYSADLAYCTILGQKELAVEYFRATKQLAESLHIAEGYSEAMIERFNNNLDNNDSLYQISNSIYWKTCNYLEANEDVNVLPFIIFGSWLESVYLTMHSYDNPAENQKVLEQVAVQANSVDNLIEYMYQTMLDMKVFNVNSDIQRVSNSLKDLKVSYDKVRVEGMTSLLFDEIKRKYDTLRDQYLFEPY